MRHVVVVEWYKLVTLGPARWTVGGVLVATPVLVAVVAAGNRSAPEGPAGTLGSVAFGATALLQMGFAVLGVLAVASEQSGGQLSVTLTAMPVRRRVMAAKAIAVTALTVPTAGLVVAIGLATAWLAAPELTADPGARLAWAGAGCVLYLAAVAVCGLGVGAAVRGALAPVTLILGYLLVIGPLLRIRDWAPRVLPDAAGAELWSSAGPVGGAPGWPVAAAIVLGWAAVLLATGAARFCRRDA